MSEVERRRAHFSAKLFFAKLSTAGLEVHPSPKLAVGVQQDILSHEMKEEEHSIDRRIWQGPQQYKLRNDDERGDLASVFRRNAILVLPTSLRNSVMK